LLKRANIEGWAAKREQAYNKSVIKVEQKVAAAAGDTAAIAIRIKAKLLKKLEKEIDDLPDSIGSETRQTIIDNQYDGKGNRLKQAKEISKAYKLVELATTFEKLTKGMNIDGGEEPVRIVIDV
jgi:hypothetical protein